MIARQINGAVEKASRSAVNKMLAKARTRAVREIRQTYNIKSKDLTQKSKSRKPRIYLERARGRKPQGAIVSRKERIPLFAFGAREGKRGVTVKVKRQGGRKLVRGAFLATARNTTTLWKRKGKKRLPIEILRTLSPAKMFQVAAKEDLDKLIQKEFAGLLREQTRFHLSRAIKA